MVSAYLAVGDSFAGFTPTWNKPCSRSSCSQRRSMTSPTLKPCRYISRIMAASRVLCLPTFLAAFISRSTSSGMRYSRVRRSRFKGFFGGMIKKHSRKRESVVRRYERKKVWKIRQLAGIALTQVSHKRSFSGMSLTLPRSWNGEGCPGSPTPKNRGCECLGRPGKIESTSECSVLQNQIPVRIPL